MAAPGWWDVHRALEPGFRGPDVESLQRALNEDLGQKIPVSGFFGPETTEALKTFQRLNNLMVDGKVGPLTFCTLMGTSYRFSILQPPQIRQPLDTCWAASFQSVLESTWKDGTRAHMTVQDLVMVYKKHLVPVTNAISVRGFLEVVGDLSAESRTINPGDIRLEHILAELTRNNRQIIFVFNLTAHTGHAVVVYGVHIKEGDQLLMVMNPQLGQYEEIAIGDLKARAKSLMLVSANRLAF